MVSVPEIVARDVPSRLSLKRGALPNFMLLGPGRTGTSWVHQNLLLHPDVFMPRCKSTHFFDRNYSRGETWYKSHFAGRSESALGESLGSMLGIDETHRRIRKHIPHAKLVATFRDPVERAYSAMGRLRAFAKPGDEDATIGFEDKLATSSILVTQGLYATHLAQLWELFPKNNVLVLFYDELHSNPRSFLRKLYEFLGVDPDWESPLVEQRINATATVSAQSRVGKFAYRSLLRLGLFKASRRVDTAIRKPPEPLSPEVHRRVYETYYVDEIARLEQMLDVDLSAWKH